MSSIHMHTRRSSVMRSIHMYTRRSSVMSSIHMYTRRSSVMSSIHMYTRRSSVTSSIHMHTDTLTLLITALLSPSSSSTAGFFRLAVLFSLRFLDCKRTYQYCCQDTLIHTRRRYTLAADKLDTLCNFDLCLV